MERIDFESLSERNFTSCQDNNIAILKNFSDLKEIPSESLMFDSYLLIIVTAGTAQLQIDNQDYHPKKNDMFVSQPRLLLQKAMLSVDFQAIAFIINPDYAEQLLPKMKIDWTVLRMKLIILHEIFHLDEEDINKFALYKQLLFEKLNTPNRTNKQKSINSLFCAMFYDMIDIITTQSDDSITQITTSKENIIERFFKLLHNSNEPFLNVNGYADKLNISAKYFSLICKSITGKTASQLINEEIIHSAELLLCDNSYSIKQIANKLGFINQSHFGTFFHRHVGISPQKYRISNEF